MGDGEVVAVYDDNLVRVTSRRLVALVTEDDSRARCIVKRKRSWSWASAISEWIFASTLIHGRHGCQGRYIERLTGGTIRQIRASSTPPNDICY